MTNIILSNILVLFSSGLELNPACDRNSSIYRQFIHEIAVLRTLNILRYYNIKANLRLHFARD